jgi:hypothetical protein
MRMVAAATFFWPYMPDPAIAKAKGNLRAETAAVMTRTCFTNFSKMGVSCKRPLATGLMATARGLCSTKSMWGWP